MPGSYRSEGNLSISDETLSWTETRASDSIYSPIVTEQREHWQRLFTNTSWDASEFESHIRKLREHWKRILKKTSGEPMDWHVEKILAMRSPPALPETLPIYHRNDVSLGRKIAEGGQAIVYEASLALPYSFKHEPVAVKKFKKLVGISQGHFPRQLWEYKCSHVCKPRGVYYDYDGESLCVVMDRYSSDLRCLIDSKMKGDGPPFPQPVAVSIITQLALGLRGLHEFGIYHRDLKADNILVQKSPKSLSMLGALDMDYTVVIADFEASEDVKGTGFWRAPEVLKSLLNELPLSGSQWQAADVYSFSMTCYEILTGKTPFRGLEDGLKENNSKAKLTHTAYEVVWAGNRPKLPAYVAEPLKDIIQRCWHPNPASRPSFADILVLLQDMDNHTLIIPGLNIVERMIQWESSLSTPEAMFSELVRLVGPYTRAFENDSQRCRDTSEWASMFIYTVEQFASKFGWDSFSKHPSLPFAQHVERRRLLALIDMHLEGYALMQDIATEMTRYRKVHQLMSRVRATIFQGYSQSEYHSGYDRDLILDEKLAIVEQALVEPLLHAKVCKTRILAVAVMALQDLRRTNWKDSLEIDQFCLRMQSRLDIGSGERLKCLQETLSDQGWELFKESLHLSSIVNTLFKLVMAYNNRLFVDLANLGFRRPRECFIIFVGLRLVFQCISPFLMFKLFGWKGCLVWFTGDTILGLLDDLRWRFKGLLSSDTNRALIGPICLFHIIHMYGLPLVVSHQQLDKPLEIKSLFIIILYHILFLMSSFPRL